MPKKMEPEIPEASEIPDSRISIKPTPPAPQGLPEVKRKTGKFKQSGHYVDQKLQHNYDKDHKQLTIFDGLNPETQEKIRGDEVKVQGIHTTPAEDKLLNTIIKLLHRKSSDYTGNLPAKEHDYGHKKAIYPQLRITPTELYTEYSDTTKYGTKQIQIVHDLLKALQNKKFLIVYKRHRRIKKDNKWSVEIDRIEEYQALLRVVSYYKGLTQNEDKALDNGGSEEKERIANGKGEVILLLNPILIDQIDTKFIEYPTDIDQRTAIASGGAHKVTTSIIKLRDYLMRAISSVKGKTANTKKKTRPDKTSIRIDKLEYQLGLEKYIKEKRRKLIRMRIQESIEAAKNLGLITEAQETLGRSGERMMEFTLNLDFPEL